MRPLLPFTPEGVQQKQVELYQLSDKELLQHVREISTDCRSWVENNFELNSRQKDYYSKVPETINFIWGAEIAAVIMSRGKISMAPLPEYTTMDRPKEIKVKTEAQTDYNPDNSPARQESNGCRVVIDWKTG